MLSKGCLRGGCGYGGNTGHLTWTSSRGVKTRSSHTSHALCFSFLVLMADYLNLNSGSITYLCDSDFLNLICKWEEC